MKTRSLAGKIESAQVHVAHLVGKHYQNDTKMHTELNKMKLNNCPEKKLIESVQ